MPFSRNPTGTLSQVPLELTQTRTLTSPSLLLLVRPLSQVPLEFQLREDDPLYSRKLPCWSRDGQTKVSLNIPSS